MMPMQIAPLVAARLDNQLSICCFCERLELTLRLQVSDARLCCSPEVKPVQEVTEVVRIVGLVTNVVVVRCASLHVRLISVVAVSRARKQLAVLEAMPIPASVAFHSVAVVSLWRAV